jgi:GDP-D-mannose dehydratase
VRPSEIACGRADTSRASERLGWTATRTMPDVARLMVEARLARDAEQPRRQAA